jgi:hypothetical protein
MERSDDAFSSQSTSGYRLMIFRQLQQAVETMHRPEEMFQWLASLIVQRFDVSIAQFWTCEGRWSNQPSAYLRAMASQDSSQPAYLFGEKVAMTVEQLARGQQTFGAQPVERLFPRYLAMLLQRYGLSYCCYYVAEKNVRFAPTEYGLSQKESSTGLMFITLLFLRQQPGQNFISTIGIILEQAIVLAENRRLLLPAGSGPLPTPQDALAQESSSALSDLVLQRKQDASLMLSSNPFARKSISIADKQALRLYEAIDGHLTLSQLCRRTGMTLQEVQKALQELLRLQCIEIYTLEGLPVDVNSLFKNR